MRKYKPNLYNNRLRSLVEKKIKIKGRKFRGVGDGDEGDFDGMRSSGGVTVCGRGCDCGSGGSYGGVVGVLSWGECIYCIYDLR